MSLSTASSKVIW